jgi:predicted Zn-dependent protease with MMP-like domain
VDAMTAFDALVAPSLEDMEQLGMEALRQLPEEVRQLAGRTVIRVADFPDEEVLEELKAETEFDILGLFQGVGMAQDGAVPETGRMPNMIWLYRRPILDYWAEHEESLGAIVTHVLIHEIGHHFGLSDDDMEALDRAALNEGADRAAH